MTLIKLVLAKNVMVHQIALFKIAAYVDLFCIVRYGMGYTLHEKLDLYLCLPMWQIYSKFKFASIANTVHATYANRMDKCGIYNVC